MGHLAQTILVKLLNAETTQLVHLADPAGYAEALKKELGSRFRGTKVETETCPKRPEY